jgi:hypothetical protein
MKMLARTTSIISRLALLRILELILILGAFEVVHAAEFFCSSGNVTCLIASINDANGMPGEHIINLEPGIYTLQIVDNITDGPNGLPSIRRSIRIQASADDPPTVIERDPGAGSFRIFHVSVGGELDLDGVTVQRGNLVVFGGPGIFNRGVTTLQDSIVTDASGDAGAIHNIGALNVFRSIIADNVTHFRGGGIHNGPGGNALVENSTVAHNLTTDGGGIFNQGSVVIRNSAIISNHTDQAQPGGGILNSGGSVEIVNSTIAKNTAGGAFGPGGGGVANLNGQVSIINSTIRENQAIDGSGGGIFNSGILRVQNTIVAGNTLALPFKTGPDCFGTITSLGNNLVGDPSDCAINLQPSDLTGDPGLGSLVGTGEDDLPGRAYYPVLAGSAVIDRGNPNACLQTDQLGNLRVGICDIGAVEFRGPALVSVDIRPKKDANRINPNSIKDINVAIFSVNGFDATAVNANTVRFGATGTEAAPIHGAIRDVNGDGRFDMVLRFEIQNTKIRCGDTSASLTGQTSQGLSIIGSSPIKTVQCNKQK